MSKGFTFIELIVATGILLGLVGFGTASYVNFNERQILENAAKDLKNTLRVAQENAIAGVKDNEECDPDFDQATGVNGPTPAETFRGWCVSPGYAPSATAPSAGDPFDTYQIYGVCDTNEDGIGVRVFPAAGQIQAIPLPEGVALTTRAFHRDPVSGAVVPLPDNTENGRARFNVFGNDVRLTDDTYTKVVYCLQGSFPSLGTDDTYQITINQSGEINDDGFVDECTTT